MALFGTGFCFLISLIVLAYMAFDTHENINYCSWGLIVFISVILLGYHVEIVLNDSSDLFCRVFTEISLYAVLFVLLLGIIRALWIRKTAFSKETIILNIVLAAAVVAVMLLGTAFPAEGSPMPYVLTIGDILIAADCCITRLYDIVSLAAENRTTDNKGYVAFDTKMRFMSCNSNALELMPELKSLTIGNELSEKSNFLPVFKGLIESFNKDGTNSGKFKIGDMTFICEISPVSSFRGTRRAGYLFGLRDATEEQKAIDVMTAYNETLNTEVARKTESILNIQQKVVLGMANFIENRDNNTGGHVKRTSDVIKVLVDEIRKQGNIPMSDELAQDIVRAAPTHDLGKVQIDSSILCKPGRLTDEEFAIMKTHSTKSGEMVKILLDDVEEDHFVQVAYNVARYHHERWDGRGYPDGLVGTMIPLEARIMAVADVYDALVSKRCYKEPMSFEQARKIMCEGMGTQFDPNMKSVFLGCREALENYYRSAE